MSANILEKCNHPLRKAPVFVISSTLTLALAESFRHAGANAIIGKPISTAAQLNTMRKVLANPRPFIEGANYVGPCRRAGIVTAGQASVVAMPMPRPDEHGLPLAQCRAGLGPVLVARCDHLALPGLASSTRAPARVQIADLRARRACCRVQLNWREQTGRSGEVRG